MRNTFITYLMEAAKVDKNIVLVTGDLGYSVLEPFQNAFPDRFINAGIAEQNMTGLAAGLALLGKTVVTYSIANFPTLRCLEQIRNDICYHNANVKIVSVGSGFSYGTQGYTHHGIEDISILRALPGMRIYSPACPMEVSWSLNHMLNHDGPCYMRLAKQGEPLLHQDLDHHLFPKMICLREGYKSTVLSTGVITRHVFDWIQKFDLPLNLYSVPVIKPFDWESLQEICARSSFLFTIEEHQLQGGFGSVILEAIHDLYAQAALNKLPTVFRYGVQDEIVSDMTTEVFATRLFKKLEEQLSNLNEPVDI